MDSSIKLSIAAIVVVVADVANINCCCVGLDVFVLLQILECTFL